MNIHDLTTSHSVDEILDALEPESVSYTVEELDSYFICSRDFWDGLSPEKQCELAQKHPNLLDDFDLT